MSSGPQLFKVNPSKKDAQSVDEIQFADAGFKERSDIQEWILANPKILGDDLLIIAKEFSGFDRTSERPDLVAVDTDGNVVIIELKRDDSGTNAHWQAIKYASYFQRARQEDIVRMLAEQQGIPEEEAVEILTQHLNPGDIKDLNRHQRIILASHRFAPEVTSAVVWLNQNAGDDLITCVQLTPYRDTESNSFYIQASTILPIPGTGEFEVGLGSNSRRWGGPHIRDEVTRFPRGAAMEAVSRLPEGRKPDRRSPWAAVGPVNRYYQMWYAQPPWGNQSMRYQLLLPKAAQSGPFEVTVRFRCDKKDQVKSHAEKDSEEWFSEQDLMALKQRFEGRGVIHDDDRWLLLDESRTGDSLDSMFRDSVADMVRGFVEGVTPVVQEIVEEQAVGARQRR